MSLKILQWSQPVLPHSPSSSSQTLPSAISSLSSKQRSHVSNGGLALLCRFVHKLDQSSLFQKSRSCQYSLIRTTCSASLESFSDEEFNNDEDFDFEDHNGNAIESFEPHRQDPPGWHGGDENVPADIERKARIIMKKLKWKEGFREAGESAYCSVKKAFSSTVFIIQELHSFILQMREILFYQDSQGILARVETDKHASFVWLFQQVFSHTPTLMVYVMILLANFTAHSMTHNAAIAAAATEISPATKIQNQKSSSTMKTFPVSSSNGKAATIGGGNGTSEVSSLGAEEAKLWDSMVEEVRKMEAVDEDSMKRFVSGVSAKIESDEDYEKYLKTELVYLSGLSQEPNNPLLLTNYAQFLYLVTHDYDRAEEYFKRAMEEEAADAEAYNKYGSFLWKVKKELSGAEEAYLEAISAEPSNSYYASTYAHFLWHTSTFPLTSPQL